MRRTIGQYVAVVLALQMTAGLVYSATPAARPESPVPGLRLQANPAEVVVGGTVVFTVTVKNTSPAATAVQVFDSFPNELALINATSFPGGQCKIRGQIVECRFDSLASGSSVCVRVLGIATAQGNAINTAAAVISQKDVETSATASAAVEIKPQQPAQKQTGSTR